MKSSDKKFLEIFNSHSAVMLIIEPGTGKILNANKSAVKFYGYTLKVLLTMKIQQINLLPPDKVLKMMKKAEEENDNVFKFRHKLASAEVKDVEVYSYPIVYNDKHVLYSIVYDVTEKNKAESELRKSELQLNSILESTDDSIWAVDREYKLIKGNSRFNQYVKLLTDRVIQPGEYIFDGKTARKYLPSWKKYIDRCILKGEHFHIEEELTAYKKPVFVDYLFNPIKSERGIITGVVVHGRDITESKKIQDKLRLKKQTELALLHNLPIILYSASVELTDETVWISENIKNVTGYTKDEFTSGPLFWTDRIHPDDRERVLTAFGKIQDTGKVNLEYRWKIKSGNYKWFFDSAVYDKKSDNKIYSGFLLDVTELKYAIAMKYESEEKFKKFFNYSETGKALLDMSGRFIELNTSFCKIFGYSEDELKKLTFPDITHTDDIEKGIDLTANLKSGKIEFGRQEKRYIHKDGHTVWAILSLSMTKDSGGTPLNYAAQIQDITDRKNVETLLTESENLYKTVIYSTNDVIVLQERTGKIITWNAGAERIFGMSESDIVGLNALEMKWKTIKEDGSEYPPEQHPTMITFKTGKPCTGMIMGVQNFTANSFHWISINTKPLFRSGEDFPYAVVVTATDITKQKKYFDELKKSEEKYKVLIDNANEAIYVIQELHIVFANRKSEKLIGCTHDELIGKSISEFIPAEEYESIINRHYGLINGTEESLSVITPMITKNGVLKFCRVNAVKIIYNGNPATLHMATDITDRVKTEELFNARLRLLEASESKTIDELLITTIDEAEKLTSSEVGFFHFINDSTDSLDLKQWSTNTMAYMCSAKPFEKHYPIEKAGVWADCVRQNKVIIHNDFKSVPDKKGYPEGHAEIIRELTIPIMRGGRPVAILGVGNKKTDYNEYDVSSATQLADLAWDITQKKLSDEYLKRSENNLRKINEEKDKFFSIIAHDLRSPFTAFIGLTETIVDNIHDMSRAEIGDYLTRINGAAVNLFGLLNNLLEWSLNQRGLSSFEPKVHNLKQLIEESYLPLAESAKRKNINVTFSLAEDIKVLADKRMFETIMRNLISNSVKFNNRGGEIKIFVQNGNEGNIKLCVKDNGIGMDDELIDKIFNVSGKAKRKGTEGEPSSGLGLTLCKEYVEKNGGTISIESENNKGTTICISLPPVVIN